MTRSEKRAFWARHVEAQVNSGWSVAGYCREQGLSTASLVYWKRRLGEAGVAAAPQWLPVVLEAERSSGVVVQVGAGIRLELQPGFDPVVLQQAVAALR